ENNISLDEFASTSNQLAEQGKTHMYISMDNKLAGIIAVADTVKENSVEAIERLHKMGIEVAMITGDNKRTADAIAKQVRIDRVLSGVFPEDKAVAVSKVQKEGNFVAIVGDGISDGAALADGDIGTAVC